MLETLILLLMYNNCECCLSVCDNCVVWMNCLVMLYICNLLSGLVKAILVSMRLIKLTLRLFQVGFYLFKHVVTVYEFRCELKTGTTPNKSNISNCVTVWDWYTEHHQIINCPSCLIKYTHGVSTHATPHIATWLTTNRKAAGAEAKWPQPGERANRGTEQRCPATAALRTRRRSRWPWQPWDDGEGHTAPTLRERCKTDNIKTQLKQN